MHHHHFHGFIHTTSPLPPLYEYHFYHSIHMAITTMSLSETFSCINLLKKLCCFFEMYVLVERIPTEER